MIPNIPHRHISHDYRIPLKNRSRVSNNRKRRCNTTINQVILDRESEEQRKLRLHKIRTSTAAAHADESNGQRQNTKILKIVV